MPEPSCPCGSHPPPEDDWRHVVSEVAPGLFVTGEPLAGDEAPLDEWERLGVDVVLDLTDRGCPLARPSGIVRHWLPTPDDGSPRDPRWMSSIAAAVEGAERVLVHCHMGVARAPSAAFLLMLARGYDELEAIERVVTRRPIATARYAVDVLRWQLGEREEPGSLERRVEALEALRTDLVGRHRDRLLAEASG